MKKTWMLAALMLSGCGGATPEMYQLVVNYFTLPDSCYQSGMQPTTGVTVAPPDLIQVQVWDGPDNTAYMQVESGGGTIDMGQAPNVSVSGIFTGKKADKGWTFTSDTTQKQTIIGNTVTNVTHAEFTFDRGPVTFKGTGALSSSSTCVGNQCPGTNPSCAVSGIVVQGTRIQTDYERAP